MNDPFFERRLEWSRYKHEVLDKYLRVWVYKLSSAYRELAFVDACAGAGRYEENGVEGSPLIAAKWNDEQVLRSKGGRLVVFACEADPRTREKLEHNLQPWLARRPPQARVVAERFERALPKLLASTRAAPTIFFIDPYGTEQLSADMLGPLLHDTNRRPTEVLARLDPGMLARFAGWLRQRERSARSAKAAERFRDRLVRYNIDVAGVEDEMQRFGQAPHKMELFTQYLALIRRRFRYVQLIPVRASYFAAPRYFLFHGTDNPDGAAKINDIVSTTEDALFESTAAADAGGQGFLFEPKRREQLRVTLEDAARHIRTAVRHSGRKWVDLTAELACHFGPHLREKDHRAAVRALLKSGEVEWSTGQKLERTTVVRGVSEP